MTITYQWSVTSMYTLPEVDGKTDVVVLAQWAVSGTDGTYSETLGSNTTQFTLSPDDPNFTPYDQLTESQVIGWIQTTLGTDGVASYEATIAGSIDSQANPPVTPSEQPLPWVTPSEEESVTNQTSTN
jgi:hypothetical protein